MSLYHSLINTSGIFFDCASTLLAALSAGLWLASARINFTVGYDTDHIFKKELKRAGKLNAWAATAAAVAAAVMAAKTFFVAL